MAAVRDCADTMETQATGLVRAMPTVAISHGLRATVIDLSAGAKDASGRVLFELALLQAELEAGSTDVATAVKRLSAMDAAMMSPVAALTEVVDRLEEAAERDEQYEPAFVLVIEAAGVMLQALEKAKGATQALGAAVPIRPERSPAPAADPVRVAAEGSGVLLKVGAVGGSVTLIGRRGAGRGWQFARITEDQTEALLGESANGVVQESSLPNLEWVASWENGLRLMDRYPWARLHPLVVHPEFVERVRVAVEERLGSLPQDRPTEYAQGKWERLLGRGGTKRTYGEA